MVVMVEGFPSRAFFVELKERIDHASGRFEKLGVFDVSFGVRVLPAGDVSWRLVVLDFDTYACTGVRELRADEPMTGVDFVFEAPYSIWQYMLTSVDANGRIDADHTLNTLTHHDDPIRVAWTDPLSHDKLFRFQESIQLVFDLAASVQRAAT